MILDQFRLDGKTALVTGAGTGLGRGMALGLAEAGADIAGVYHTHSPDEIRRQVESLGRRFVGIQADLQSREAVDRIVRETAAALGRIDILVNNAGIIRRSTVLEFSESDWDAVLDVNLKHLFLLSQAVARHMVQGKIRGKIINIASMLSFQGGIRVPSYTASKHAVAGLTKIMANELAAYGINVNAIAPGYMATSNTQALRDDPKRNAEILARIPAGRWGDPADLQGAVVFLASEASAYVQGTILAVDGGWLAR
jgi:2-deoxy-D-gluconate 3-dehydrogenase